MLPAVVAGSQHFTLVTKTRSFLHFKTCLFHPPPYNTSNRIGRDSGLCMTASRHRIKYRLRPHRLIFRWRKTIQKPGVHPHVDGIQRIAYIIEYQGQTNAAIEQQTTMHAGRSGRVIAQQFIHNGFQMWPVCMAARHIIGVQQMFFH